MRFFLAVFVSLGLIRVPPAAFGQQAASRVGDQIMVTGPNAALRCRVETLGNARAGSILVVKHVEGDWFWVVVKGREGTVKGWINRADVVACSRGIDFLDEELRRNPRAALYALRGKKWLESGDFDRSIADCNQAICLDPSLRYAYDVRAMTWMKKGEIDRALVDWNEALQLDPEDVDALEGRASAWTAKADFDNAAAARIKQVIPTAAVDSSSGSPSSPLQPVVDGGPANLLAAPAVVARSRPVGPLALRNVAFCENIQNYGSWTRFKKDEFKPSQPILLYSDVDGFASELTTEMVWRVVLKSVIEISNARGELVKRLEFAGNEDLCHSLRRDYYNTYEISIPEVCAPGPHTLKLIVDDELSGKTAVRSVDFIVK